jgi:hypothetical protein
MGIIDAVQGKRRCNGVYETEVSNMAQKWGMVLQRL